MKEIKVQGDKGGNTFVTIVGRLVMACTFALTLGGHKVMDFNKGGGDNK